MALGIVAVTLGPMHRIFLHLPTDNNEGWNAYHAVIALSGGVLYPPVDSLISTNYPPLSFYIVGLAGKLVGDNIIAGRLISLASLLAVSVNVYRLSRLLGAERFFAGFSSMLFLLYIGTNASGYVAMNDPQFFGHALVTTGAVYFLKAQVRNRPFGQMLISALFCVSGVLVKQNLIVLPLALFIWAAFNDRRGLLAWTLLSLVIGSSLLLLAISIYGPVLLQDIFLHQRVMSVSRFNSNVMRYVMPLTPLVVYAGILGAVAAGDRRARLALIYAVVAGALGLFFLSGELCDVNIVFDLIIALCIAAGLAGNHVLTMLSEQYRRFAASACALVIASVCLPTFGQAIENSVSFVREDRAQRAAYQDLISEIARSEGPVACEMTSLCYWAGKAFEFDAHNYLQKIKKGKVSPDLLRRRIDEGYYTYILATGTEIDTRLARITLVGMDLSPDVADHYAVVRQVGDQQLLAPRQQLLAPRQ
jgi:hypothetical protein